MLHALVNHVNTVSQIYRYHQLALYTPVIWSMVLAKYSFHFPAINILNDKRFDHTLFGTDW